MLVLLVFSGIISASEVALFSLAPAEFKLLNEEQNLINQKILAHFESDEKSLKPIKLAILLIANNFINISIVVISYVLFYQDLQFSGPPWVWIVIQTLFVTLLIIIFGEVVPKHYGYSHNLKTLKFTVNVLSFFSIFFHFPAVILVKTTKYFERKNRVNNNEVTADELNRAIDLTFKDHEDHAEEKEILKGIVNLGKINVRQIMKPRTEISAVSKAMKFTELIKNSVEERFSRYPVYNTKLDNIEGVIYLKDLLAHSNKDDTFNWHPLIRKPLFVPEFKAIDSLLREFQKKRVHMAIVVDEYGGCEGLVTLEDILEEVVGDIRDEFDGTHQSIQTLEDETLQLSGSTPIQDVIKNLGLENDYFDIEERESDSIAGFLIELGGYFPEQNEIIQFKGLEMKVLKVENNRIVKVQVKQILENDDENNA